LLDGRHQHKLCDDLRSSIGQSPLDLSCACRKSRTQCVLLARRTVEWPPRLCLQNWTLKSADHRVSFHPSLTSPNRYMKSVRQFFFCIYGSGAGAWPSGQSGGLARQRSRFDPRQGRPLYIWMHTPSAVCILGMDMCAIQKFLFNFS
jgi:hypothetical protein